MTAGGAPWASSDVNERRLFIVMLVSAAQSKVARQWKLLRCRPNSTGPLYEVILGFVGSVLTEPVLRLAFQKYSTSRIDPGKDDRTFFVAVEIS